MSFLFLYSSTIPARYASAGALASIADHDSVAVGSRSTQAASPQHREHQDPPGASRHGPEQPASGVDHEAVPPAIDGATRTARHGARSRLGVETRTGTRRRALARAPTRRYTSTDPARDRGPGRGAGGRRRVAIRAHNDVQSNAPNADRRASTEPPGTQPGERETRRRNAARAVRRQRRKSAQSSNAREQARGASSAHAQSDWGEDPSASRFTQRTRGRRTMPAGGSRWSAGRACRSAPTASRSAIDFVAGTTRVMPNSAASASERWHTCRATRLQDTVERLRVRVMNRHGGSVGIDPFGVRRGQHGSGVRKRPGGSLNRTSTVRRQRRGVTVVKRVDAVVVIEQFTNNVVEKCHQGWPFAEDPGVNLERDTRILYDRNRPGRTDTTAVDQQLAIRIGRRRSRRRPSGSASGLRDTTARRSRLDVLETVLDKRAGTPRTDWPDDGRPAQRSVRPEARERR